MSTPNLVRARTEKHRGHHYMTVTDNYNSVTVPAEGLPPFEVAQSASRHLSGVTAFDLLPLVEEALELGRVPGQVIYR